MADPTTVSNLYARWKADVGNGGASDGGRVSSWTDSLTGLAPTQSSTARPFYRSAASVLNNAPAIEFVKSSSQRLQATTAGQTGLDAFLQNYSGVTISIVLYLASINGTNESNFIDIRQSGGSMLSVRHTTAGVLQFYRSASTAKTVSGSTLSATTKYVITVDAAPSGSSHIYLNGTIDATDSWPSNSNVATTAVRLGSNDFSTRGIDGHIGEVLIYSSVLSDPDRATVHTYYQDLYGVTVSDYVVPNLGAFGVPMS